MKGSSKEVKKLYFVGIKGVAMAGLAIMAREKGYQVIGSDVDEEFITDELLVKKNVKFFNGFSGDNIRQEKPDLVVVGAAYGTNNPEVKVAKTLRIPQTTLSEMLGKLMEDYEGVGISGVHGKTTVTSMLTVILQEAGFSPSYTIGTSNIPGLVSNAHIGSGKHFVVEADEYKRSETDLRPKFLDYPLKHLVITSIELDHPDVYSSAEHMYQVFYDLAMKIPRRGTIVANSDWPLVKRLISRLADRNCLSYGFDRSAKYQIVNYSEGHVSKFYLKTSDGQIGPIELKMPGQHNMLNAAAAYLMALHLGVAEGSIIKSLKNFQGPKRRFEYLGNYHGADFYDDYAHHPTALKFLIAAAKNRFPSKKITVVFQPHTYSRTSKLLTQFAQSLLDADRLVLLNIWASAREKSGFVTIRDLIKEIHRYRNDVEFRTSLEEVADYLAGSVSENDVVLLVGAGDVYKVYDKLPRN